VFDKIRVRKERYLPRSSDTGRVFLSKGVNIIMTVKLTGLLIRAKRGTFTPDGKDAPIDYWQVGLQDSDGSFITFGFDFALGEQVFGNAGSLEAIVNKAVEITAKLSQFEGRLRLKGTDIHLLKS